MQVFVIGANGWIGGAIIDALIADGHQVRGLVRSDGAKQTLEAKGARGITGDLTDSSLLARAASEADAVVFAAGATLDTTITALDNVSAALDQTGKSLIYISGSSLYGDIGSLDAVSEALFVERLNSPVMQYSPEARVFKANQSGVRGVIVIGAGLLYGRGSGATPEFLLKDARVQGIARYIGEGSQKWSAVHVDDLARLVVQTLEQKPDVPVFNAVSSVLTLKEIAEIVAEASGVRGGIASIARDKAIREWGEFWGNILAGNLWLSSELATTVLGWQASAPSFSDDLLHSSY